MLTLSNSRRAYCTAYNAYFRNTILFQTTVGQRVELEKAKPTRTRAQSHTQSRCCCCCCSGNLNSNSVLLKRVTKSAGATCVRNIKIGVAAGNYNGNLDLTVSLCNSCNKVVFNVTAVWQVTVISSVLFYIHICPRNTYTAVHSEALISRYSADSEPNKRVHVQRSM